MSQKQIPELELNNLKFFLSQFEELYNDIELLKKQREFLELPLDLSINLKPVDMNDVDSLQQALREHEQMLLKGAKDPLIFGLKKIFEQNYREFRTFFNKSSFSSSKLVEDINNLEAVDKVLAKLVDEIPNLY